MDTLRTEISSFLRLVRLEQSTPPPIVLEALRSDGFTRKLLSYPTPDGDLVEAFLFEPDSPVPAAAVVMLHQHNSEWSLGKSEIAGIAGDPLQAFGPILARAGVFVLAPDAIGFESRRGAPGHGTALAPPINRPHGNANGWLQYYNHAMHRLVRGELLIRKVLADVAAAITVIQRFSGAGRVGLAGHSYGGIVTLFAAALDVRVGFACSSGAACSFRHKLAHGTGLEMALVIPGFAERFDLDDLIRCMAPRKLFVVSSEDDPLAADATDLVANAAPAFQALGVPQNLRHLRSGRGHALDADRFSAIVRWLTHEATTVGPT
jgi:dienelactone hydrolase